MVLSLLLVVNECPSDNDCPSQPVEPPAYDDSMEPPPSYSAVWGAENQAFHEQSKDRGVGGKRDGGR